MAIKDGTIKLADFGVAAKTNVEISHQNIAGTPYWSKYIVSYQSLDSIVAPEVIELNGVTTACDIWYTAK